jgi:hypothetical protein
VTDFEKGSQGHETLVHALAQPVPAKVSLNSEQAV